MKSIQILLARESVSAMVSVFSRYFIAPQGRSSDRCINELPPTYETYLEHGIIEVAFLNSIVSAECGQRARACGEK